MRHLPLDVFSTPQQQTSYEPVKSEIVTRGNDMFSALCVYSVPPSLPYSLCCCTYISYTSALCFFSCYLRTYCSHCMGKSALVSICFYFIELPPGGVTTVTPSTSHSPTASIGVTPQQCPQGKEDGFIHLVKLYAAKVLLHCQHACSIYTQYKYRYRVMHPANMLICHMSLFHSHVKLSYL